MKRIYLLSFILCLLLQAQGQDRAAQIREKLLSGDRSSVMVVAHRGDWRYAPENSIAAIEHSIKMGVDVVELDLQRTKDGVLILMHDAALNRTTNGKGAVEEWTMDSIRTLKMKNGCGIRTKEKVPTLEETLTYVKGRVMINLDKADRYFDEVYALLKKTGTTKQIIMKGSKTPTEVQKLYGKYLDEVIYMPVINLDKDNAEQQIDAFMKELRPVAFELLYADDSNLLPKKINEKLSGKSLIWYNTLWDTLAGSHDDDKSLEDPNLGYGYLIDVLDARIIQTDRAEYLLDYLRSRKLHD